MDYPRRRRIRMGYRAVPDRRVRHALDAVSRRSGVGMTFEWWMAPGAIWASWFAVRLAQVCVLVVSRRVARHELGMERGAIPSDVRQRVCRGPVFGAPRLCRSCWHRIGHECGHLIRWVDGGPDIPSNMVPQCRSCNAKTSGRTTMTGVVRWATPWVGWRFPIPTPALSAAALWVAFGRLL